MNQSLASLARKQADSARAAAFSLRAREHGGVNSQNREQIMAEAAEAGRHAFESVYTTAGYRRCGCDSWVNPAFARCYVCGALDPNWVKAKRVADHYAQASV